MMANFCSMLCRFNKIATRIFCAIAGVCLGAMTSVVLLQVFCRYVLNAPLSWPEEASRFMMVWMTFLVAPFAYREGLLVRLESWVSYLSDRKQHAIQMGTHILAGITLLILLREAVWMVDRGHSIQSSALGISMAWIFFVMPVSFILLLSVACELTIVALAELRVSTDQAVRPGETP